VIESREATRLGENVQLLTFVSIFYLPLGFCVAMWSINESYSVNSLLVVAAFVALGTYVLTANLNLVVRNFTYLYKLLLDGPRTRVLVAMARDEDAEWSSLGRQFTDFNPANKRTTRPTEWLLVLYVVRQARQSMASLVKAGKPSGDDGNKDDPSSAGAKGEEKQVVDEVENNAQTANPTRLRARIGAWYSRRRERSNETV